MKKEKKGISRRSFLKAVSAIGVSAVSTTPFHEAHAAPLRVPGAEYGREQKVPVIGKTRIMPWSWAKISAGPLFPTAGGPRSARGSDAACR
jgi:hypothetical protein